MALESAVTFALNTTLRTTLDLEAASSAGALSGALSLATGTAAGQADKCFLDKRTLAASATEDLDLAGVLLDAFGAAITMARVKAIAIKAAATNANNVVVGAATSAWATLLNATGTITLRPGAVFVAFVGAADATGWAVTASSGDLLKVANSGAGTSVTYEIAIIGASA